MLKLARSESKQKKKKKKEGKKCMMEGHRRKNMNQFMEYLSW